MLQHERKLRPALAGLIILCFLLPFVKISCGGQPIASMTGIDLVLGNRPDPSGMFGDQMTDSFNSQFADALSTPGGQRIAEPYRMDTTDTAHVDFNTSGSYQPDTNFVAGSISMNASDSESAGFSGEPFSIAALALAVLSLICAFSATRKSMLMSAVASGLAAIALFILKSRFSGDMPPEAAQVIQVEWTFAYWIALIGSAVLAGFTFMARAETPEETNKPRFVMGSYTDNQPVHPGSR
jgi:hypothetical protein